MNMETDTDQSSTNLAFPSYQSSDTRELYKDLSKVQQEMGMADAGSVNPRFKNNYANWKNLVEGSRTTLCKYQFAVTQQVIAFSKNDQAIFTKLQHPTGQWIGSLMYINPSQSMNDAQAIGSYMTYVKRYCYAALIGIYDGVDLKDDDGESITVEVKKEQPVGYNSSFNVSKVNIGHSATDKQIEAMSRGLQYISTPELNHTKAILETMKVSDLSQLKSEQVQKVFAYIAAIKQENLK